MKKEKILTVRPEVDMDKFYEEFRELIQRYDFTNLEFAGILEFIKNDFFKSLDEFEEEEEEQ